MADILRRVVGIFDKRYRDMGDGTHAEVIAIGDLDHPLTVAALAALVVNVLLQANAGVNIGNVGLLAGINAIGNVGLSAGDELIGEFGIDQTSHGDTNLVASSGISISQTPTVTAGAYSANDAVGGLLTFPNAALVAGGGGVIKDTIILDDAGQDANLELWLFNATFTAMVDNAPWAPSQADLRKLVAVIDSNNGTWFDAGTPSACQIEPSKRYDCVGTSLFGQVVNRSTPTFAATDDVTVILGLLRD